MAGDVPAGHAVKKSFTRRRPDQAQLVRRTVQAAFLLLNLWIGARFYAFVRFYETGGASAWAPRPPGVEGWLPIGGLMNLTYFARTGLVPQVHPAAMFLLAAFLLMAFALRKAFCSWLCPVGTVSEWLWQGGQALFGRTFDAPRWLDIPLRGLKYLLLGFFANALVSMPVDGLKAFMEGPYGLMADVKMLNFFRFMGTTATVVMGVLVLGSVLVKNVWCRYLCPYGALLGLVALASPTRIRRDPDACIDCSKCATVCPSRLPVDRRVTVKSSECTACLECVTICPAKGALSLSVSRSRAIPTWAVVAGLAVIFLGFVGYARFTGHWAGAIPDEAYRQLVPAAAALGHPQ